MQSITDSPDIKDLIRSINGWLATLREDVRERAGPRLVACARHVITIDQPTDFITFHSSAADCPKGMDGRIPHTVYQAYVEDDRGTRLNARRSVVALQTAGGRVLHRCAAIICGEAAELRFAFDGVLAPGNWTLHFAYEASLFRTDRQS